MHIGSVGGVACAYEAEIVEHGAAAAREPADADGEGDRAVLGLHEGECGCLPWFGRHEARRAFLERSGLGLCRTGDDGHCRLGRVGIARAPVKRKGVLARRKGGDGLRERGGAGVPAAAEIEGVVAVGYRGDGAEAIVGGAVGGDVEPLEVGDV